MTATYGRQFTYRSLADMLAKAIKSDAYRKPRWWEISRRGERIPADIALFVRSEPASDHTSAE